MFGAPRLHGLYYYHQHSPLALPLLQVAAQTRIKDLSAGVNLTQLYTNDSNHTIECSYRFPVPARAAVTSFALVKQDGTRIVGLVQEKEEARETYDQAVEEGKLASLMEQQTPDTFQVSVGNILPHENVTVELSYSTELTEDEVNDSIRFHLPAHIGARYGEEPSSKPSPSLFSLSPSTSTSFFHLDLAIESVAPIRQIGSPSHTISTSLGPEPSLPNASEIPFSNYARVTFSSDSTLDKDFILTLQSTGLDAPRCLAELHPSPEQDTAALSLSMVPKFKLPDIGEQEYLFLVDRSGSMGGERISMARKALVVLLRSLPKEGTRFNIVSFGNSSSALWSNGSRGYSQATLDEATKHVDGMDADFGGTEMRKALEATFSSRKTDKPTSVFVLTDGDAWDLEGVNAAVSTAVTSSPSTAPLRVFVLGIGNSASTAMCEGIARAGNGTAQFVVDGESFTGKTARLLKAARSPQLLNVRLELPESAEAPEYSKDAEEEFELVEEQTEVKKEGVEKVSASLATLSLFDDSEDPLAATADSSRPFPPPPAINLPPPPPIQQAPRHIQSLSPGTRLHAYLILTPASLLPRSIFLRAELASGQKLELEVPVTTSQLPLDKDTPTPIHALAARKLIQDLEDGRHGIKVDGDDEELLARTVKAHVVRLGKTYSLASPHTSFIAVDESEVDEKRQQVALPCRVAPPPPPPQAPVLFGSAPQARCKKASGGLFGGMGARLFSTSSSSATPPPPPAPRGAPPAAAARAPVNAASFGTFGAPAASSYSAPAPRASGFGSPPAPGGALFGSSSSGGGGGLFGSAPKPFATSPPPNPCIAPAPAFSSYKTMDMSMSTRGGGSLFAQPTGFGAALAAESTSPPPSAELTPSDRIDALARHQAFDGSFSPSAVPLCSSTDPSTTTTLDLETILTHLARIRIAPLARFEALSKEEKEELVATACVVAFWEKEMEMEKLREEWEGMAEKAKEFGEEIVGEREWEELVRRVKSLV
ncbi:von Willebrand factor type A domain-domain-containing protein [Leucosporidium creatinivorum]|uniref:von Willebrand factor type A domain-domain-containing protein n=1 Tax=Leucosporidium creatinivorum TaxID=106004 RepID=A0A1Y2G2Z4_9BASI|nr:von Willebrand factor type A domain-domain-containing protein [Leucosporidium creatinivorum]